MVFVIVRNWNLLELNDMRNERYDLVVKKLTAKSNDLVIKVYDQYQNDFVFSGLCVDYSGVITLDELKKSPDMLNGGRDFISKLLFEYGFVVKFEFDNFNKQKLLN